MHRLAARVWRTVRRFDLMPAGARVLAAVSGGADSVALVHLLRELDAVGRCRLAGIAHLNHSLRDAADADEAFCRSLADTLGVPFESGRADVRALAHASRVSLEAAGHTARYAFLEGAAARLGADRVALGHTRDDQAETFLLRLLRGAGPRGLAGMHPQTGAFIRPLLDCSRSEIRAFVEERGLAFREDASNADLSISRNRLRHEVLPVLARFSARAVEALARAAEIARQDADFLDTAAAEAFGRLIDREPGRIRVDAAGLRAEPDAVARRVAAAALRSAASGRFVASRHVEALLALVRSPEAGEATLDLPGQVAVRQGGEVLLRPAGSAGPARPRGRRAARSSAAVPGDETNSFRFSLSIPGEVRSPSGWALTADFSSKPLRVAENDERQAVLDARLLGAGLVVRNWCPGDRFRPLGLSGRKKLQDFFVDRKVPRAERRRVPLVVAADGRVAWVAGYAVSEDFRVGASTSDVVILKLKYWRNGT